MKTQTLTINGQDYAIIIHKTGMFDAAQEREVQRLGELHKVKHFKTQTEAAKFVADLIGCNQNTFKNRIQRGMDWQEAVNMGKGSKKHCGTAWRLPAGQGFLK